MRNNLSNAYLTSHAKSRKIGFMSFPKAVQHIPEYEQYLKALLVYKAECKRYKTISLRFKNATTPAERLVFLEARERYSKACKLYSAERFIYANALALARIKTQQPKEPGILTPLEEATILGIKVPTSLKDVIEEEKNRRIQESFDPEEFERLRAIAMQHPSMQKPAAMPLDSALAQNAKNAESIEDSSFAEDEENPFGPA